MKGALSPREYYSTSSSAMRRYYNFFSVYPEDQTYFKIKVDIDGDLESAPANAFSYVGFIQVSARRFGDLECNGVALHTLLGFAARTAANRRKLAARFELIEDIVDEPVRIAECDGNDTIVKAAVEDALAQRRRHGHDRDGGRHCLTSQWVDTARFWRPRLWCVGPRYGQSFDRSTWCHQYRTERRLWRAHPAKGCAGSTGFARRAVFAHFPAIVRLPHHLRAKLWRC